MEKIKPNKKAKDAMEKIVDAMDRGEHVQIEFNQNEGTGKSAFLREVYLKAREKQLKKFIEDDIMSNRMLVKLALDRTRFIFDVNNKTYFQNSILLDGQDFDIIDQFCESVHLPVGHGYSMHYYHFLNYYKNKMQEVAVAKEKDAIKAFVEIYLKPYAEGRQDKSLLSFLEGVLDGSETNFN